MEETNAKACSICNGMRFVMKDGIRYPCTCAKRQKMLAEYPFLTRLDLNKANLPWVKAQFDAFTLDVKRSCVVVECSRIKEAELFVFMMLLLMMKPESYCVLNTYEMVEIFLGKHDKFQSVFSINTKTVCLLLGWNEMTNCRHEELVLQYLDICKTRGVRVLFFIKGDQSRWPGIQSYLRDADFDRFKLAEPSKKKGLYSV